MQRSKCFRTSGLNRIHLLKEIRIAKKKIIAFHTSPLPAESEKLGSCVQGLAGILLNRSKILMKLWYFLKLHSGVFTSFWELWLETVQKKHTHTKKKHEVVSEVHSFLFPGLWQNCLASRAAPVKKKNHLTPKMTCSGWEEKLSGEHFLPVAFGGAVAGRSGLAHLSLPALSASRDDP